MSEHESTYRKALRMDVDRQDGMYDFAGENSAINRRKRLDAMQRDDRIHPGWRLLAAVIEFFYVPWLFWLGHNVGFPDGNSYFAYLAVMFTVIAWAAGIFLALFLAFFAIGGAD